MQYVAELYSFLLLIAMLVCLEIGRRYGLKRTGTESASAATGRRIVEGAFFGLLSLLLAFSFSGAVAQYDSRRALIVQEANQIGAAYLRVDLLPPEAQPRMRELFRDYVDSRLVTYDPPQDIEAAKNALAHSVDLEG
jgi:hypothetical protein